MSDENNETARLVSISSVSSIQEVDKENPAKSHPHQTNKMHRRLPVKFLIGILVLGVIWFLIMFTYMDELFNFESNGSKNNRLNSKLAENTPMPDLGKDFVHRVHPLVIKHHFAQQKELLKNKSLAILDTSDNKNDSFIDDLYSENSNSSVVDFSQPAPHKVGRDQTSIKHNGKIHPKNDNPKHKGNKHKGPAKMHYDLSQNPKPVLNSKPSAKPLLHHENADPRKIFHKNIPKKRNRPRQTAVQLNHLRKRNEKRTLKRKTVSTSLSNAKDIRNNRHSNSRHQMAPSPTGEKGVFLHDGNATRYCKLGKCYTLLRSDFTPDMIKDIEKGQSRHSFQVLASEMFPLDRDVPDTRPASCPQERNIASLPKASVIICFHNEAWTTLLRTVHSVINRTPPTLLEEIILVDDNSTYDYLQKPLEKYMAEIPRVLLIRTKKREGLIRARLKGVAVASGEVLVFLDSHCECNSHWIEPLLSAIKKDKTKIVSPEIDVIRHNTFEYIHAPKNLHGGFNWKLQFVWKNLPKRDKERRHSDADPIRTPTMIGGLFAVDKAYFEKIGSYDSGMDIWGSENIELSFRVWMCGGSLEILPCSRVGHLFRPIIPYGFPSGPTRTIMRNAVRVAEVWLGKYRKYFYATQNIPDGLEIGSLSDRRKLKKRLSCHDFGWYLKNIVPEFAVPPESAVYWGELRNMEGPACLDFGLSFGKKSLRMVPCHGQGGNQIFYLTNDGQLIQRNSQACLLAIGAKIFPTTNCGHLIKWTMNENKQIQVLGKNSCVTRKRDVVVAGRCDDSASSVKAKQWQFPLHLDPNKEQWWQ